MTASEPSGQHFLQQFYADITATGDQLLHIARQGITFRRITKRQAVAEISLFIRALHACGIQPESRVTFQAIADYSLWVAEWGVLANHCVAVIVPDDFSSQELVETLAESKSKLAIVDTLATAKAIVTASANLPDLTHILCLEGDMQANLPVLSWDHFIESGAKTADRSGTILRSIASKDTAMLFYDKNEDGQRQATRYTHALLFAHAQKIDELLGNSATVHAGELVLTVTAWGHMLGHMVSYYLPVLKGATMQITSDKLDLSLFENAPHIVISKGAHFSTLQRQIVECVKQWGPGSRKELQMALALGKIKYESGKLNPWQRVGYALLRQAIIKKVQTLLGGRLRLFISVDDSMHYETQLFFETFGIELVELPPDILKQ